MMSQFKYIQNNSCSISAAIYRQIMSAGSAQFLLTICWHSMSAGFVENVDTMATVLQWESN